MTMNAANISFTGGKNLGGTAGLIHWAYAEDVLTWPATLNIDFDAAESFGALVTVPIDDPFVFKPGKGFLTLDCTLEEGEVTHKQLGTAESYGFENGYDNNFAGNDPAYLGFSAFGANKKFVVIAEELNGKRRVIGFPNYPARIEANDGTSGKKVSDGRKNTLSFKCRGAVPPPIYLAPIPVPSS